MVTRFPPEPNGYLHIGHAKSICLNFGIAEEFGGPLPSALRRHQSGQGRAGVHRRHRARRALARLRLGQDLYHASDYFDRLYEWAELLIQAGKAYVDDQSPETMRVNRGTLTEPGKNSPFRDRTVDENLDLFRRMKAGEFDNGARVLRAKIDMASGNINLRDPTLYRIVKAPHPRTGTKWSIYPSYDFAHGQSDAIEGITHSICTLEFEDHRPLYDWFLDEPAGAVEAAPVRVRPPQPHLHGAVEARADHAGPRRPCQRLGRSADADARRLAPPRRAAGAIRDFVKRIGVAKANSVVDAGMLDFSIRETLNKTALRRMAVLRPLKVVIENYPEGQGEELDAVNHPDNPAAGSRKIKFGRELYIERDDFMENPPKKFFRLSPGTEVRLRYAFFITCREVVKNASGEVVELRCTYDPATRGGNAPDGRKVKATIHWVSADGFQARRGAALQSAVRKARSERRRGLHQGSQSEFAGGLERRPRRAGAGRGRATPPSRCSSSARAISSATRTPQPTARCSIRRCLGIGAQIENVLLDPQVNRQVQLQLGFWRRKGPLVDTRPPILIRRLRLHRQPPLQARYEKSASDWPD